MIHILSLWKCLPVSWREKFWSAETDFYIARSAKFTGLHKPIVVAGLFRSASGLGSSARAILRAMQAIGLNVIAVDLTERFTTADISPEIEFSPMPNRQTGVLILVLNGPETATGLLSLKMFRGRAWKIIGLWAWELEAFPNGWDKAFRYVSEIWAVSDFAANAISKHSNAPPVRVVPNPVGQRARARPQASGGLKSEDEKFNVVVAADTLSSLERKNTLAGIEAFKIAFEDRDDVRLTVKIRNLAIDALAEATLTEAIDGMRNVEIIAGSMSEDDYQAFLSKTDVFLSLHRSEGFGMALAEMMSIGKVAMATKYSGNLFFMTEANSILIDCAMIDVEDPYGVYRCEESKWADASVEQAAFYLRRLVDDSKLRNDLGARARSDINQLLSFEAVGTRISELLKGNSVQN